MPKMTVTGLANDQVLQRGRQDAATISLSGTCDTIGGVEARILAAGGKSAKWQKIGTARGGKWRGKLTLPTGGPYRVEFRAGDATTRIERVLVGDLWVLAGQSNMEGVADLDERVERPHPLVHSYGMNEKWEPAVEPLHYLDESIDPVHNGNCSAEGRGGPAGKPWRGHRTKGAGCGLAFAKALVERTGVPIGLIPCAHGGTTMGQWDHKLKHRGGKSLYGAMLRRVNVCGGRAAGVLWYQGESDAQLELIPAFRRATAAMVAEMRRDFGGPTMPFLYAQIGYFAWDGYHAWWNEIQQAQLDLEALIPHSAMAATIDLPMDDNIHVGTDGLNRLGRRLATLARRVMLGDKTVATGPRPADVTVRGAHTAVPVVRVRFTGVNGRLSAPDRPMGFTVLNPDGTVRPEIVRVKLLGDTAEIVLNRPLLPGSTVQYGRGTAPFCNIVEGADLAVPVFGPRPIRETKQ